MDQKNCLYCGEALRGRSDKKYCNLHCKSAYQYERSKNLPERFFDKVDNQLRLNRKILKEFNKGGKVTVRKELLTDLGFNDQFSTHAWRNQNGDVYHFVYEYGYLKRMENGREKYVLIIWQDYMEK
ncbi:hypothetical protein NYZ99_08455 [Maribacter litopenaei]|uniref:DUF2116 family Zn-ribbon domain-containing protein n=1 Tax=Maribacter litopenaei TaxID=2976127 RepID=A0ABY5YBF7_9FLAO|nr:hypothetical protein [Maribacter litopenaei]UWX56254.1 hypothetical protein NYZ99_08455 [Maribacter litopenaei]